MTIAATITAAQFIRNGATTQWSLNNKIFSAADVTVNDLDTSSPPVVTPLVLGVDFTVQNIDVDTGFSITTTAPGIAGHTLDVRTNIAELQTTSIKNQGSFLPELHEEAFDKLTREIQDLRRLTYAFGIHGPDLEAMPWTALPIAKSRAGGTLAFDTNGLPTVSAPGSTTSAFLVPFLPPGTGGVATNVGQRLSQTASAFDFMTAAQQNNVALGIGSIDVTAAIQAAANSLGTIGGTVLMPPGTYLIPSAVTFNAPTILLGAGAQATTITTNSATANIIVFNALFCGVEHIGFTSSVTRTGGAYISLTSLASNSHVRNFYMTGYFIGILSSNSSTQWFSEGLMFNPAANGTGVQLTGTVLGGGNDIYLTHITMSGTANVPSAVGINLQNAGAVNITDCDIIRHGNDLLINPGNGQLVAYVYCNNSYFDTATNGVNIAPTGTGLVQGVRMMGCWTSAHTGQGVNLAATGGTIAGVELIGQQCFSNGGNGVAAGAGTDLHILGGVYAGNTSAGLSVTAGVSFFSVVGARMGNGYNKAGNAFGIFIAVGASNEYLIVANDLTGNTTTNFSDGGTGTIKNIRGNTGIPVGPSTTITVGASPFTYTSGALPETIYISQGTVSLVTVNGLGVFQSSNVTVSVQPNNPVVVTWTVAPSMAKTINNN